MTEIAIQLENHSKPGKTKRFRQWRGMWFLLGVFPGFLGGSFTHRSIENTADMERYVKILTPMLVYDRDYDQKRAREMNDDMRLVSVQIHLADAEGLSVAELLDRAMPTTQVPPELKKLMVPRLLENLNQGKEYGLFTAKNLNLLLQGKAPTITRGAQAGQRADVEHIVPRSVVPLMDNLLVNLEWLPQKLNTAKNDSITKRAYEYAEKYFDAGLLHPED